MCTVQKLNLIEQEPAEEERVRIKHMKWAAKRAATLLTKGGGRMTHLPSMPWRAERKRLSYGASMQSRLDVNGRRKETVRGGSVNQDTGRRRSMSKLAQYERHPPLAIFWGQGLLGSPSYLTWRQESEWYIITKVVLLEILAREGISLQGWINHIQKAMKHLFKFHSSDKNISLLSPSFSTVKSVVILQLK